MKFNEIIAINEAVVKNEHNSNIFGEKAHKVLEIFKDKLNKKDFRVKLSLSTISSIDYVARRINDKELKELINTASMSKDFLEKKKAVNTIMSKKFGKIKRFCTEILPEELMKRGRPYLEEKDNGILITYVNGSNPNIPYVKFLLDKNNNLSLISLHDNKYSNKSKYYGDKSSYKFGSHEKMKEVKDRYNNRGKDDI